MLILMTEERKGLYSVKSCPWLLLFVFYLQFVSGELLVLFKNENTSSDITKLLNLAAVQVVSVALPCVVFLLLKNAAPGEVIKHRRLGIVTVIMCVLTGISAQPIVALFNSPAINYLSKHGQYTAEVLETANGAGGFFLSLLVIALMPAVFEEILMRGIVLHATEKEGYRLSLFVSAIWFAVLHNDLSNIFGMLFLGLVLCYAVWMTQSVYAGIIIHFSFNAFGLCMQYFNASKLGVVASGFLFLLSAAVFVLAVSSLNRKLVRRYKSYGLGIKLITSVLNVPMIIILIGFAMLHFVK